jgi:hypothetical protein
MTSKPTPLDSARPIDNIDLAKASGPTRADILNALAVMDKQHLGAGDVQDAVGSPTGCFGISRIYARPSGTRSTLHKAGNFMSGESVRQQNLLKLVIDAAEAFAAEYPDAPRASTEPEVSAAD